MRSFTAKRPLVLSIALLAAACAVGLLVTFTASLVNDSSGTVDYRFCNVEVPNLPEHSEIKLTADVKYGGELTRLIVSTRTQSALSLIIVDPESGELHREDVRTAREGRLLHELVESIRIVHSVPEFWPYAQRTQLPVEFEENEYFRYRQPDPGAGLLKEVSGSHGGGIALTVKNCRSSLSLFQRGRNAPLETVRDEVHMLDRAAFDTFIAEVQPK
jgi:hypothetical protein